MSQHRRDGVGAEPPHASVLVVRGHPEGAPSLCGFTRYAYAVSYREGCGVCVSCVGCRWVIVKRTYVDFLAVLERDLGDTGERASERVPAIAGTHCTCICRRYLTGRATALWWQ